MGVWGCGKGELLRKLRIGCEFGIIDPWVRNALPRDVLSGRHLTSATFVRSALLPSSRCPQGLILRSNPLGDKGGLAVADMLR